MRKRMTIDLHGWTYDEVRDKLPNMLILYHNRGVSPIEIITGNSEKMKLVVRDLCKKHNFKTYLKTTKTVSKVIKNHETTL